jgi:hypothetical protein
VRISPHPLPPPIAMGRISRSGPRLVWGFVSLLRQGNIAVTDPNLDQARTARQLPRPLVQLELARPYLSTPIPPR